MTLEIALTLTILVASVILFALERLRPDLIAVLVMLALAVSGILETEESFGGFATPAVMILVAAFIISSALSQAGVSRLIGSSITRLARASEIRIVSFTTFVAALLSLIMNNVAAAAVLLPGMMDVSRRTSISPSRLLIPLARATQLGGMATLLTTSNLVASAALRDRGLEPFGILDFFPVGGPIALAGILYLIFFGRRLLPHQNLAEAVSAREHRPLPEIYDLHSDIFTLRVRTSSPLVNRSLEEADLRAQLHLNVVVLEHSKRRPEPAPAPSERLRPLDLLTVHGPIPDPEQLDELGLDVVEKHLHPELATEEVGLVEVVLSPRSSLAEKTLRDVRFRERYRLTVVAIWRSGGPITDKLASIPLQFGDALLIQGTRGDIALLQRDSDFLVLTQERAPTPIRKSKIAVASVIIAAALAAGISGVVTIAVALVSGAALLVLTRSVSMEEGYRAIDWRSIVVVGAMLPLGTALNKTGAAELIGGSIAELAQPFGAWFLLGAMVFLTVLLTQTIPGGAAVPLVLVPLAAAAAISIDADPRAFAMAVALATSTSMLTPFAHPVSTMVMGLGGYTFRDYFRTGLPLVLLSATLIIVLVPLIWGL
jgi:di/tricarboxylate transporter